MTRSTPLHRKPYRRRNEAEWDEMRRLYQAGATARALVEKYGGTERTLYARARRDGWRRMDDRPPLTGLSPGEADAAVRVLGAEDGVAAADAPCRALAVDASLGEAARAAAQSAIRMLRDLEPARAYTYARLAGTLERLARGGAGGDGDGDDADGTERGRRAALDFLRGEGAG
ncbi:hypothetical protein [uncultured Brevundimonas sp.]|uniref:hypothetical protein n=1 Tax=uncultured Brevundimonas sp. TaxID=213418 RepID=UPI0030EBCD14|tara:strand:+ start:87 stop:605 length:519 start_codon:yes stop_codon:yes gene_type:complete